jgi:hypothetical protein
MTTKTIKRKTTSDKIEGLNRRVMKLEKIIKEQHESESHKAPIGTYRLQH